MNEAERRQEVVLKVVGTPYGPVPGAIGMFVRAIDYTADDNWSRIYLCEFWTAAMRFDNEEAAADWATRPSPVRPEVDGRPFCPGLSFAYGLLRVGALLDVENDIFVHGSPTIH